VFQQADALADAADLLANLAEPRFPKSKKTRDLLRLVRNLIREVRGSSDAA
jgi:hypothetical protein